METISPDHIRWHVRFLAHDLLERRGTGQRGGDLAAEYMATQFAEYGLKLEGPALNVASWIHLGVAEKLAASSAMNLEKMMADARSRAFHPVSLGAKLKAHMVSKVRDLQSNNVVAMLPGSDRNLKQEAVMYTAHYDHFGIRPDMPGDNIFNGAQDNATGCGI